MAKPVSPIKLRITTVAYIVMTVVAWRSYRTSHSTITLVLGIVTAVLGTIASAVVVSLWWRQTRARRENLAPPP